MRTRPGRRRRLGRGRWRSSPPTAVARAALLAGVLDDGSTVAARASQQALAQARHRRRLTDDDLLPALASLAAQLPEGDAALGRLLVLLVDLEGRAATAVAPSLGLSPVRARALLDDARRRAGTAPRGETCRGWGLAAGRERLTAAERQAADGHLALCRRCRDRLTAVERTRREVLGAAAGAAALSVGAAAVSSGTAAAAGGGLIAGKAVTAMVAGLGAAVALGGGVAALTQSSTGAPARPPAVPAPAVAPLAPAHAEPTPSAGTPGCASRCVTASPGPTPRSVPIEAAPSPTVTAGAASDPVTVPPVLPLPSLPAVPLPSLPAVPLPSLPALPMPGAH